MRATVSVTMLDGSRSETTGDLMPLADRVAFERQFGQSAVVLTRLVDSFDDEGKLTAEADPSQIREEWVAFLAWRMLRRGPARGVEFLDWLETVSEVSLDTNPEEAEAVPTVTAVPLPTS